MSAADDRFEHPRDDAERTHRASVRALFDRGRTPTRIEGLDPLQAMRELGQVLPWRVLWSLLDEPKCVGAIADELAVVPSTVSKSLKRLRAYGLVRHAAVGHRHVYAVDGRHVFLDGGIIHVTISNTEGELLQLHLARPAARH